jgi:hypothetical protein
MVASPEDPFVTNPYIALEIQEPVELGGSTKTPGSVWKWLVAAVVIEAAKTVIMIIFHSSSPRVSGINIYAIGNLFLSGVMAVTMAWFLGRRSSGPGVILIAQLGNLLIWLMFGISVHLRFGIRLVGEGTLLLTSFVVSAILSLIATLISKGAFKSRS